MDYELTEKNKEGIKTDVKRRANRKGQDKKKGLCSSLCNKLEGTLTLNFRMQLIAMQLSLEAQKLWELVRGKTSVYGSKNMRVF